MNDARCDPAGRIWGGPSRSRSGPGLRAFTGSIPITGSPWFWMMSRCPTAWGGVRTAAGCTTRDTVTERVDVFDYDLVTGRTSGHRAFVDLHDFSGRPDGLTVDAEGGVWVTMARGGTVRRFDPAGRLDEVLTMPLPFVTSCAFGGEGLRDLYVTTTCAGIGEAELTEYPHAGGVLRIADVGVTGLPGSRFAG